MDPASPGSPFHNAGNRAVIWPHLISCYADGHRCLLSKILFRTQSHTAYQLWKPKARTYHTLNLASEDFLLVRAPYIQYLKRISYVEENGKQEILKLDTKKFVQCVQWAGHVAHMGETASVYSILV